jgi:hypothetical protein
MEAGAFQLLVVFVGEGSREKSLKSSEKDSAIATRRSALAWSIGHLSNGERRCMLGVFEREDAAHLLLIQWCGASACMKCIAKRCTPSCAAVRNTFAAGE